MIYPELKEVVEKEGNEKDFEYKGYKCHIRRVGVPYMGHLCGYIEIPKGHELHGMTYDEIEDHYNYELPSHGGLTFSGEVDNSYWIGFDCAHYGDLCPMFLDGYDKFKSGCDVYRNMEFVENNIKKIIDFIFKEEK